MKKKTVSGATYYFCYVCKYRVRRALIINNKRPDLVWSMLRIVGSTNMEVSKQISELTIYPGVIVFLVLQVPLVPLCLFPLSVYMKA